MRNGAELEESLGVVCPMQCFLLNVNEALAAFPEGVLGTAPDIPVTRPGASGSLCAAGEARPHGPCSLQLLISHLAGLPFFLIDVCYKSINFICLFKETAFGFILNYTIFTFLTY